MFLLFHTGEIVEFCNHFGAFKGEAFRRRVLRGGAEKADAAAGFVVAEWHRQTP